MIHLKSIYALTILCLASTMAFSQESAIRKVLGERLPAQAKIDQVTPGPVPGLYEIRVNGTEIYYTDAKGDFLIHGSVIDTKTMANLTEDRISKLTAIRFDALPFKDAFTIVRGNGKRKFAVFEDPNCGYCKQFERNLQRMDNVTVHMFLYPILGQDSVSKSKNIWCAKDKAKSWQDWMVRDTPPVGASCDASALDRNVELGRKFKITGTPTIVFVDGSRVPGAVPVEQIEARLK